MIQEHFTNRLYSSHRVNIQQIVAFSLHRKTCNRKVQILIEIQSHATDPTYCKILLP